MILNEEAVGIFHDSLDRCKQSSTFIDTFYDRFILSHAEYDKTVASI